ncbi:MAG: hypothetical protein Q4D98_02390 [Planctomycetia bacterium]|nr:hypothetical protein [Planctomycetia bacterium]
MKTINYRELKRRVELDGLKKTTDHLTEAIEAKQLAPEDFSLRDLAESLVPDGSEWVRSMNPGAGCSLLEGDAVDSTAFLNVAGQVIHAKIREAYQHAAFVASKLVDVIPSRLSKERIPGVGKINADTMQVAEGMPYPNAGFGEEYVDTPETTKQGLIVPVTKEAIFFDQTGLVLRRAAEVGEILGAEREKRILDTILGVTNTYKINGKSYNTYYASGDGGPWVNKLSGNALADWTDVDAAEQLFAGMTDPNTDDPILLNANAVLVMPSKRYTASRIFLNSEMSWSVAAGSQEQSVTMANPFRRYTVADSAFAYRRLIASGISAANAANYWYLGDFKRAFAYLENWGLTVTRSSQYSEANFTQDIVVRYKASERGTPAVLEPRCVVCCTE